MVQQIIGYIRMGDYSRARSLICGLYDSEIPLLIKEISFEQLENELKLCLKAKDYVWIMEALK